MDMKGGSGDGFFLQRRLHVRPYSLRHCRRLHPSEAKRTHKNWLNYFLYYVRNVRRCIIKFVLTRYFLIHSTLIQKALWFISVFVQCFPFTKKFFFWLKGFTPPPQLDIKFQFLYCPYSLRQEHDIDVAGVLRVGGRAPLRPRGLQHGRALCGHCNSRSVPPELLVQSRFKSSFKSRFKFRKVQV